MMATREPYGLSTLHSRSTKITSRCNGVVAEECEERMYESVGFRVGRIRWAWSSCASDRFELLLVASFIALRLFSGATRTVRKTADVDVANLAVEPTK